VDVKPRTAAAFAISVARIAKPSILHARQEAAVEKRPVSPARVFNERWSNGVKQMHRADLEKLQGEFKNWTPTQRTEFVKKPMP
jgi:hypothetical protein